MNPQDDEFLKQTRKALDESADSLDGATLSRLNQARQKALQSAVAIVTAWLLSSTPDEQAQQLQLAYEEQDMDMLTSVVSAGAEQCRLNTQRCPECCPTPYCSACSHTAQCTRQ